VPLGRQAVLLFAIGLVACHRAGPAHNGLLTTAGAVRRLSWDEASARPQVQLAGTVTVVDHFTGTLFVQDQTGAVWVTLPIAMRAPTVGATINLRGTAVAVGPDRAIINPEIESLQPGTQPEPRQITRKDLTVEHKGYTLSRFRVRIKQMIPTIGKEIRFSGEMVGGLVEVSLQTAQALDVGDFIGKEVDVTGVPAPPTQASTTALPLFLAQKLQPLAAAHDRARLKCLTTIREVKALDPAEVRRAHPVDLHGVVTTSSPRAYMLAMQDATGAIFVWLLHPERYPPEGFRIHVEGTTAASESLPMVAASKVTIEEPAPMPTPVSLARFRINDDRFDNLWVHVDGVVRYVSPSPIGAFQMVVATDQCRTTAIVRSGTPAEAARFVPGTPVSFDGTYSAHADRFRRWRAFLVYTPSLSGIRIRRAGPKPQVADLPLRTLFRYGSESSPATQVRIRGIVTLDGTDGSFFVSDGDGGVQVVPATGSESVKPGTFVEVTGFLPTDPSSLRIEDATWRGAGTRALPAAPVIQAESALDGSYESRWIRLEGRLTHRQEATEHNVLVLQSASALVNVYSTRVPDAAWESLRVGSTLMVRGVVLPPLDRTGLAGLRTVSILTGSSQDIQVLRMASWWTPEHLTAALILLAMLLFALFLLASVLARRVWSQSRTIAKRLEVEAALKLEAQAASRAKSQFLAAMSHEIRTPMNGVLGLTELATRTIGQPEQMSYLQNALQSARSLMNILNDILDLAKIEAGKMTVVEESFSFSSILQSVIAAATVHCNAKGLQLICGVKPDVPDGLIGDGKRFQQILSNLASNACKFTETGKIEIIASAEGRLDERLTLVVHVRDTGIGIAPDQLTRVFGDFEQVDRNDSRRYEGTGLGLAICLRLAHLLGGQLDATSKLGEGSDFRVSLPMRIAVAAETAPQPAAASVPEPAAPGPLRILAAEDNHINRLLLGRILEMAGHKAVFAADGAETLRLWEQGGFDLMLMDLQMPVMDGLETAREIRRREAGSEVRTPIVAVTARAMSEDRNLTIAAGMDGYISKPYSAEELLTVIRSLSHNSKGGQAD
jgi:signal transduction histidine kinase/ActR/RegA family two-component response regulator